MHQISALTLARFIHAGVVTTLVDGKLWLYAALSMMPDNAAVLTVEFRNNFIPHKGKLHNLLKAIRYDIEKYGSVQVMFLQ